MKNIKTNHKVKIIQKTRRQTSWLNTKSKNDFKFIEIFLFFNQCFFKGKNTIPFNLLSLLNFYSLTNASSKIKTWYPLIFNAYWIFVLQLMPFQRSSKVIAWFPLIYLNLMGCTTLFLTCMVCLNMFPNSPCNPNE